MWIRDVEVPPELVNAARAGQLVIFVGAGASRDEPSGLPDFPSLVRSIGLLVGSLPDNDDLKHPDVYLGRLADTFGIDVHQLVANAIDRSGSQPNALHDAVVRLASVHPSPRIVTTNYDVHLTAAAEAAGLTLPVYESPALPVGDDFEGIVHLHGSLRQETRHLVVTDNDFGRAYLLEAWAARLLERMFSAFTVLFIGYSHGDVVMQYLARSLGPPGRRFVCTSDGDDPTWRQYGLIPVPYDAIDGNHVALPTFLARWAELTSMGQTEHRALIYELVASTPPTIPEEVSYLDDALEHPVRIHYFVEKARGGDWFEWVAGRPAFQALFDRDGAATEPARILMSWVADHGMLDKSVSPIALRAMRDKPWTPEARATVVHRLFQFDGEIAAWLSPWLILAIQSAPGVRDDVLDMLLAGAKWNDNINLAITLLEDRTRTVLKPAISFTDDDAPRFDIDLPGDEHWLFEAWAKVFVPSLDRYNAPILASLDEQIARVYRVLGTFGSEFDPISFGRSAIEPHEQDSFREVIDVLIDAARDCVEHALTHDVRLADRFIDSWVSREQALFRRLAIHAWKARPDRTADEKLRWLQTRDWLWEVSLQHEVYLLLQDSLPAASSEIVEDFVVTAQAGPPAEGDEDLSPYRAYNLLAWLATSAPDSSAASKAFEASQAAHPQFAVREHPELSTYMSSGFVEDAPPYSPDELHARISEDADAAVETIRKFRSESLVLSGPTWTGALRSVQACVAAYPEDGLVIASVLHPDDGELQGAIIRGWGAAAELNEDTVETVLVVIESWDSDEVRRPVANMLASGGTQTAPTPWHRYSRAREVGGSLWPTTQASGTIIGGDDLLMEAINHPAGDLAQFWTKVVQWEWAQAGEAWTGLTGSLVGQLDRMIGADNRNGLLAGTFLASQLHFYFGADRDWAVSRLLPLLDWSGGEERARGAWQGFLTWGRPNDGLLSAGLLEALVETCRHLDALKPDLSHQLSTQFASIALHAGIDPLDWLPGFVVAAPENMRIAWAGQVGRFLEEVDSDEVDAQWNRWINSYWSGRVQSIPLPLASAEASAMARWLIALDAKRAEAVALLVQTPAGLPEHGGFLHHLHDLDLKPDADNWAVAITHLLAGTTGPNWALGHYLQPIVEQLREADPALDLSRLINEALRLGVTDAAEW